jgi:hypothetical protein
MGERLSDDQTVLTNEDQAFDVLRDLEQQTHEDIRNRRAHDRVAIKAKVVVLPGNVSASLESWLHGVTGDISEGGCRAMLPLPIYVGDVFRLTFDHPELDLPIVFARCMRCRLIREDSFEAGFKFFNPVSVASAADAHKRQLLI